MSDKPIKLICPNLACRTVLSVPARARGKEVRCRMCGTTVGVPAQSKQTMIPAPAPAGPGNNETTTG